MKFTFAERADTFGGGIFSILNEKKILLEGQGRKVYNLSVGTPDFQPDERIMRAVSEAATKPENYKYSLSEMPELIQSIIGHYNRRFGVKLTEQEVMAVYGSQEGIAHIGWALLNPGDAILVPNPGYPIFNIGPYLCDAEVLEYPLLEENHFLPDLDGMPEEWRKKAKAMIVSYPMNPVCKTATPAFYERLIAFAQENQILIIHDNAYSDIVFDGREGRSFLSFAGAKEVGVEFYSLSKSYNYTGARMSFLAGNEQVIAEYRKVRSQIDYGHFYPVQFGAIAALDGPQDGVKKQCLEYQKRRDVLCGGFREIGWKVPDSEGSMFVWAPVPGGYRDANSFVMDLMERTGVIVTPGSSFGSLGEGYVRMALVLPTEELKAAVEAVKTSHILNVQVD